MRGVLTLRTRAESNIAECCDAAWPPPFSYSTTRTASHQQILHLEIVSVFLEDIEVESEEKDTGKNRTSVYRLRDSHKSGESLHVVN